MAIKRKSGFERSLRGLNEAGPQKGALKTGQTEQAVGQKLDVDGHIDGARDQKLKNVTGATGEVGARKPKPKRGTASMLAGAKATQKRKSSTAGKLKRSFLTLMIGVMALNAVVAPSLAQAQELTGLNNQPTVVQTLEQRADTAPNFGPLSLKMASLGSDLELGDFKVDVADAGVQQKADAAYVRFESRVRRALHRDAASLAEGKVPVEVGADLSVAQEDALKDALKDFFGEMPVGALSENAQSIVRTLVGATGADTSNLGSMRIKDLGDPVGDHFKEFAESIRKDRPVLFWSVAGAAGAGVAAHGYLNGSDALDDLGIKPEISHRFNVGQTEFRLGVGADWEAKFQDFTPELSLRFEQGAWRGSVSGTTDGEEFGAALRYRPSDVLSVAGRYQFDDPGEVNMLSLGARFNPDHSDWSFGGDTNYNFNTDDFGIGLGAGFQPSDSLDMQLRLHHNSTLGTHIGLGATYNF